MRCLFKTVVLILLLVSVVCFSCANRRCGSPEQVQRWEKKTKMRAQIKLLNKDSCFVAKKMAMSRKF